MTLFELKEKIKELEELFDELDLNEFDVLFDVRGYIKLNDDIQIRPDDKYIIINPKRKD